MEKAIKFLKAISDKNRLLILFFLYKYTLCVCDLQRVIPLTQGALSIQLTKLVNAGLLASFKQGKWVFYKLDVDNIKRPYLQILLQLFNDIKDDDVIKDSLSKFKITKECEY